MVQLAASKATSQKAAATSAAAGVLIGLHPEPAAQIQPASASALAEIPEGEAKANALALGKAGPEKILPVRPKDGPNAPHPYCPKTNPAVYVPTPTVLAAATSPM